MSDEEIKVIFIMKKEDSFVEGISSANFIGFLRGLARCYRVGISNYEGEENSKYPGCYCVPVLIPKKAFEMVKGQAGSYGVTVKEVEENGL